MNRESTATFLINRYLPRRDSETALLVLSHWGPQLRVVVITVVVCDKELGKSELEKTQLMSGDGIVLSKIFHIQLYECNRLLL